MIARTFWGVLAWASVLWYSTLTVYVAFRGLFDIDKMLAELKQGHEKRL